MITEWKECNTPKNASVCWFILITRCKSHYLQLGSVHRKTYTYCVVLILHIVLILTLGGMGFFYLFYFYCKMAKKAVNWEKCRKELNPKENKCIHNSFITSSLYSARERRQNPLEGFDILMLMLRFHALIFKAGKYHIICIIWYCISWTFLWYVIYLILIRCYQEFMDH